MDPDSINRDALPPNTPRSPIAYRNVISLTVHMRHSTWPQVELDDTQRALQQPGLPSATTRWAPSCPNAAPRVSLGIR